MCRFFSYFSLLSLSFSSFLLIFLLLMYCVIVFRVYYNGHDGKITCTYVSRHSNLIFSTDNGDDAITTTSSLTFGGMREA